MSFKLVDSKKKEEDQKFINCKDFFKNIRYEKDSSSPIRFDMDNFMLCLILGLKLDKKENFDIVHQLNMVGYREPGYLWKIDFQFFFNSRESHFSKREMKTRKIKTRINSKVSRNLN